jgi:DNA-binding MltR family transcriptional regulator
MAHRKSISVAKEFEQFDTDFDFRRTLSPETDRGCALMAAAYLDERLDELLRAFFIDDKAISESILGRDKPLSTFSSRIDLAYLLGLISPKERTALHIIRKIRNEFGHVASPLSFDEPKNIAPKCRNLENFVGHKEKSHRSMFTTAVMVLLGCITGEHSHTEHRKIRADMSLMPKPVDESVKTLLVDAMMNVAMAQTPQEKREAIAALQVLYEGSFLEGKARRAFTKRAVQKLVSMIPTFPKP